METFSNGLFRPIPAGLTDCLLAMSILIAVLQKLDQHQFNGTPRRKKVGTSRSSPLCLVGSLLSKRPLEIIVSGKGICIGLALPLRFAGERATTTSRTPGVVPAMCVSVRAVTLVGAAFCRAAMTVTQSLSFISASTAAPMMICAWLHWRFTWSITRLI